MAYIDQYAAARVTNFLQRLEMALVTAARDIITEAAATPYHHTRVILATQVLRDPTGWTQSFKDGVATNLVTDASADADFYTAVSALWNGYAGITFNGALST